MSVIASSSNCRVAPRGISWRCDLTISIFFPVFNGAINFLRATPSNRKFIPAWISSRNSTNPQLMTKRPSSCSSASVSGRVKAACFIEIIITKLKWPTNIQVNNLEAIRKWDAGKDPEGLLEFIRPFWEPYGYMEIKGKRVKRVYMATGGWSGNESIIAALHDCLFFAFWWQKSKRGGAYWFKIKQVK